jgi:hypothetical protein
MTIRWREIPLAGILFVGVFGGSVEVFGQTVGAAQGDRSAISGLRSEVPASSAKNRPATKTQAIRISKQVLITPLNSTATTSPAESFALSGTLAYVCDDNEISVVDVSNPSSPQIVATALSQLIQNSANIHCSVQRNTLVVFADQTSSLSAGPGPGVSTFNLSNPLQPVLITATPINKRFFEDPAYVGNFAFVPISALTFFQKVQWDGQYGDLLSIDLTNLSSPALVGTLEVPQVDSVYGGQGVVLGATQAQGSLLYVGGSTSTGGQNNGTGRLQVVDASIPNSMVVAGQLLVPNTILFNAPLVQSGVAVGIGNNGGYASQIGSGTLGNIVLATFDVSNPRAPTALANVTTTYKVGSGGGAARIGNYLFAFAGVQDASNNNVLLIVDATNPSAPVLQSFPISQPFTSMQAAGATLYATLGAGGFATYSIPGLTTGPPVVCPSSIDAMLVVDRGAQIPSTSFLNAKASLKSFVDSLNLQPDQVGVVSFTTTAQVNQVLGANGTQAKSVVDGIVPGGTSYIGAGIAAAQLELASVRHNASATTVMIVVSDGADRGAPSGGPTTASLATAAKAAGIRIVALQYGSTASPLMQSIASSASDFYLVSQ